MGFIFYFSLFCVALMVKGAFQSKEATRRGNIELGIAALFVLIVVLIGWLYGPHTP